MTPIASEIKRAFAFLGDRGYELVAESDGGIGGAITYRSTELWIAVGWDRGETYLEIAPTHSWLGRVSWNNIDHLLRGIPRYEHEPPLFHGAPVPVLAAFIREHLDEIEARFTPAERPATEAFLRELEADRGRRADEYWQRRSHDVDPTEVLRRGCAILDPVLRPHGFHFERGDAGVGSGGPFACGAYVRHGHRLEFSVRWALGDVVYRVGDTVISHEALMQVVVGPRQARYPGFSADPIDGFRDLAHDLEQYGKVFLRDMEEGFHALARSAEATRPRSGFKRLSDVERG